MEKVKTKTILKPAAILICTLLSLNAYALEREGGISVGAYGSTRFELSKGKSTFTLRRVVPTLSATIEERLKFYTELEFERFGLIELQESLEEKEGGLLTQSELEGSKGSEIKLEQMWGDFEISRPFRIRIGAVLPPVGRFNIFHDDDLWEPARRPLSVRDSTVLPGKTAWTEIGAGFLGNIDLTDMLLGYEFYVVNGVTLEHDMEFVVIGGHAEHSKHNHLQLEAVIKPSFGNFKEDTKREKAFTGRISLSPLLGYEIGLSGYFGRYTPSFLPDAKVFSGAFDFRIEPFNFLDIEGEYAYTAFGNLDNVLAEIAKKAFYKEGEALFTGTVTDQTSGQGVEVEAPVEVEAEIALKKKSLADAKHGGWILFRFKFFPEFLRSTPLNVKDSKFILFSRPEFVEFKNTIAKFDYENGKVKDKSLDSPQTFRWTAGIAYRPIPTFVFSCSFEQTSLLKGNSFAHSNGKDTENVFLVGFSFGL